VGPVVRVGNIVDEHLNAHDEGVETVLGVADVAKHHSLPVLPPLEIGGPHEGRDEDGPGDDVDVKRHRRQDVEHRGHGLGEQRRDRRVTLDISTVCLGQPRGPGERT